MCTLLLAPLLTFPPLSRPKELAAYLYIASIFTLDACLLCYMKTDLLSRFR
jgi:hypothetical protein